MCIIINYMIRHMVLIYKEEYKRVMVYLDCRDSIVLGIVELCAYVHSDADPNTQLLFRTAIASFH